MQFLNALAVALVFANSVAAEPLVGSSSFCVGGRLQNLTYSVKQAISSDLIIDVDTLPALQSLSCDIDGTRLKLTMVNVVQAVALTLQLKLGNAYIVGGEQHGCPLKVDATQVFLLRRVIGAERDFQQVIIMTSPAQYDEVYEDASISYSSSESHPLCGIDQKVCIGFNADPILCDTAKSPLPVYSNRYISLSCDNCFAGFKADIFFEIEIRRFSLQRLAGGMREISLNSAVDLAFQAQASWSAALDKELSLAGGQHAPILSFKIGRIPFVLWFELMMQLKADVRAMANAEASAGVQLDYNIGDSYISWDPVHHWQHVEPTGSLHVTPTVMGSALFHGTSELALIPRLKLHANQIFSYELTLTPRMDLILKGDEASMKICEMGSYEVILKSLAELHLNIEWAHIHKDRVWGPMTIWQRNGDLPEHCVPNRTHQQARDLSLAIV